MTESTEQRRESPQLNRRRWLGLASVALAQLMIVVDMTIINVALPSITADLAITTADRQWVVTAYTLPFAGLLLLGGRVSDRTGRKRALLVGLAGFAAASVAGGAATNVTTLLVARAAQGAFGALLAPASLSLVATTFVDPKERTAAFGVFGGVVAAGSPIGLILGGTLTTSLSWHWVFYVNVPIALVAALGVVVFLRESRTAAATGYDFLGAVSATAGLVAIVWGFTRATQAGWAQSSTIASLAAGVVLLALFLLAESRVSDPLLPPSILRHRGRGGSYLVIVLMMAGPFGAYLFMGLFLQDIKHYSALRTGLAFLPLTLGVMLAVGLGSRLTTTIAPRFVMGGGLLLGAVGMALLTRLDAGSGYASGVLPSFILIGVGMGLVLPAALDLSTFGLPPGEAGVAGAMFNVSQQTGASLDTALLNTVAANGAAAYLAAHGSSVQSRVHGYTSATGWAAAILLAAAVAALLLIDTRLGKTTPVTPGAAEAGEAIAP
ncbi:MFS transporter [Microbispora sp. CA-135349]|uniref:MFS transporter n=1 Tax=Microbispora sp. CA-135349 TaxID=3239953 RepID=UPI003D8F995E